MSVFMGVCSKNWVSAGPLRATREIKHSEDDIYERVKETRAKCGALN